MQTPIRVAAARHASPVSFRETAQRLFGLLRTADDRGRQRRALAALDARLLRDVGISRAEALLEAGKPFWR